MNKEVRGRVGRFQRRTIDLHLPLLVGMMAEAGRSAPEQDQRASTLVELLREIRLESQLISRGRPRPVEIRENQGATEIAINAKMLAQVDDRALAGAMAGPIGQVLGLSPVIVGLVLKLDEERDLRSLASQLAGSDVEVVALNRIEAVVRWRMQTFEDRLLRFVEGIAGPLEPPGSGHEELVAVIVDRSTDWPKWSKVKSAPYLKSLIERVDAQLSRTPWGEYRDTLLELIWESLVISPRSALRQAAQTLRSLPLTGDPREVLKELAASLCADEDEPLVGYASAWPSYQDLSKSWEELWRAEDELIGAPRGPSVAPPISVFEAPGAAMGIDEPEDLPWEQPLLCWTQRERAALTDLLVGMKKSLAQKMARRRSGRVGLERVQEGAAPLVADSNGEWLLRVPSRLGPLVEGLDRAVDRAFAATQTTYLQTFASLDPAVQRQCVGRARGVYQTYLSSTKSIWARRLASAADAPLDQVFSILLTGLAEALERPVFVDVFEAGIDQAAMAMMPCFTLLAVWYEDAEFATVWLPVEALGESLSQAPLRIRNVAVTADEEARVRWLGDFTLDTMELGALSAERLLRRVHQGNLLLTIHRR